MKVNEPSCKRLFSSQLDVHVHCMYIYIYIYFIFFPAKWFVTQQSQKTLLSVSDNLCIKLFMQKQHFFICQNKTATFLILFSLQVHSTLHFLLATLTGISETLLPIASRKMCFPANN